MANNNNVENDIGTLGNTAVNRQFGKAVAEDFRALTAAPVYEHPKAFKKVDSLNDAGEQENTDEVYDSVEEDYLLDDNSELTIEDFIATGEAVGDEDEDDDFMDDDEDDSIITDDELAALDEAGTGDKDDEALKSSQLDSTDDEGLGLNEKNGLTGSDLDVPGAELDDDNESIGEEDEENNSYSTSGQHDNDQ